MRETTLKVRQAREVAAPPERAWPVLASPAVWSLQRGRFSFEVALPDGAGRLRVVLTVWRSGGLAPLVFEVSEEVPGRSLTLRRVSGPRPGDLTLRLSADPGRRGTKIAITAQERVRILDSERREVSWQAQLTDWVAECATAITGRRPPADDGLPADVALAYTAPPPAQDAGETVSASASMLVSGPVNRVWGILRDPAFSALVDQDRVAAGELPGLPGRPRGELKYAIRRAPGGCLRANLVHIEELEQGRTLRVRGAAGAAYAETHYQLEPDGDGTRLAITTRVVIGPAAAGRPTDLDARMTELAGRYKTALEARLTSSPS